MVEKDYWIMHSLYSLREQHIEFELKGGTSLSKGFGLINRFSEDIDIHIKTNFGLAVEGKPDKTETIKARKKFYDLLASKIIIDGIHSVTRDYSFDDQAKYRSGGIRLHYKSSTLPLDGLKDGILLEAGFDTVTPNIPKTISSWVWQYLKSIGQERFFIDNRAVDIPCYHPGYTLVEKLQTIVRKFRNRDINAPGTWKNFLRQYYDVYCLLGESEIVAFLNSTQYHAHKKIRFRGEDSLIPLSEHPALLVNDAGILEKLKLQYKGTANLYYKGQPPFEEILERIRAYLHLF